MADKKRVVLTPEEERENNQAVIAHVLPFALWLTMMVWLDNPSWSYTARSIGGLILLAAFRPWRWYSGLKLKNIPAAIGVGVLIFFVWVGFETPWMLENAPVVAEWYDRLFVDLTKPFKLREMFDVGNGVMAPFEVIKEGEPHAGLHVYDPKTTGLVNFWIHMFGTSVVIAVIEEFFFRGFLYRWMLGSPFFKMDSGKLSWAMLMLVSVFFGIEHFEWMAGIVCGIAFGLLYIKTQDIWAAIIAHGTTNFLLGLYVVKYNAYHFW